MSSGGGTPAPDYETTWTNYSGWLVDAKSRFEEKKSMSNTRAAAGGVAPQSGSLQSVLEGAQQEYEGTSDKLVSGASMNILGNKMMEAGKEKPIGDADFGTPSKYIRLGSYSNLTDLNKVLNLFQGTNKDSGVDRFKKSTVREVFGLGSKANTDRLATAFEKEVGRKPTITELYYTNKYGIAGAKPAPQKPSVEDTIKTRSKPNFIGATPEEDTRSPWI